jgi:hypothetical protein
MCHNRVVTEPALLDMEASESVQRKVKYIKYIKLTGTGGK